MTYRDEIERILSHISADVVDFGAPRVHHNAPTQVSSEFLIKKEQGDWAENTLLDSINSSTSKYIAVKYGRDDNIVAGEPGFRQFYAEYQRELDTVGKRPDILIFSKEDFLFEERNISQWPTEELDKIVPKAKCGIEVRSSAFRIKKYEDYAGDKDRELVAKILSLRDTILERHGELLNKKDSALFETINSINADNFHELSFRAKNWHKTEDLRQLSSTLKELKQQLRIATKRNFLSITPKIEDLRVVYTWIKRYNVPHYYIQVFFDRAYGISFKKILEYLAKSEKKDAKYYIEGDVKNQNKMTVKIRASSEAEILAEIRAPEGSSAVRELGRGRLLYYIKFKKSDSKINKSGFEELFGFKLV